MKTLLFTVLLTLLVSTNGYSQCKITDSRGTEIRSQDCFGALLRVETDKFIYATIEPEGFVKSEHAILPQYFTAGFCQSEGLLYSPARSLGYFFEPVQYVDDSSFYYPEWKTVATGGSAIRSYWDGYECHDSGGQQWWDDRTVFAPLMVKARGSYTYRPPFKMSR